MTQQQIISRWFRWAGVAAFVLIVIALVAVPSGGRLYAEPAGTATLQLNPSMLALQVNAKKTFRLEAVGVEDGAAFETCLKFPDVLSLPIIRVTNWLRGPNRRVLEDLGPIDDANAGKCFGAYTYLESDPKAAGRDGNGVLALLRFQADKVGVATVDVRNTDDLGNDATLMVNTVADPQAVAVSDANVWTISGGLFKYADWDGDGSEDPSIFMPGNRRIKYRASDNAYTNTKIEGFGPAGGAIVPLAGQYNDDACSDPAAYHPDTGVMDVYMSSGCGGTLAYSAQSFTFPSTGGTPVAADLDGDGKDDPAKWDPDGTVHFYGSNTGSWQAGTFGPFAAMDMVIILAGDFDADSTDDLVAWYYSGTTNPTFEYQRSEFSDTQTVQAGFTNAMPFVVPDYDGDGKDEFVVRIPGKRQFTMWLSGTGYSNASGDKLVRKVGPDAAIPGVADLDGDGAGDLFVYDFKGERIKWLKSSQDYNQKRRMALRPATSVPVD